MKFIRALTVAALFAALFVLALPVHADCGDSDPTCLLEPPVSVEIRTDSTSGDASMTASESDALTPLKFTVPMPLPRRVEAPLVPAQPEPEGMDSIADFTTLSIPMRYQAAGDVSCGVQALGMALEPLEDVAPSSAAILDFLSEHQYLYDFGTGVEELAHAAQAFGYSGSVSFHNWTVDDLQAQLAIGRPVVIDLGANGPDEPGHFVALTGISPDGDWIAYSDPLLGERVVPLDDFLALWALQGNSGVAVAEAPPAPLSPDYAPWAALAATMMATLALAPSMLSDVKRRGVGGLLIAEAGSGTAAPYVGMSPPYAAPEGMKWVKGKAVYETHTRTEIVYTEVPKKELQKVQVGTTKQKIPYTKRVLVDNGRWVTDYKSERYIKGYRNKRILDGYRTRRYVKYYRTRLVRTRWGYSRRRTPVYGTKRTPVYRNLRVPIYGTRKVPNGRHWESKWEHEEYTEYKTVVRPVYEERWVNVGVERIPEEITITERELKGHSWDLIQDPNYNPPHDLERFPAPTRTWLEEESRPSWIEVGIWNSLSADEKESVFAEGRSSLLTWWEWVLDHNLQQTTTIKDWDILRTESLKLRELNQLINWDEDRLWINSGSSDKYQAIYPSPFNGGTPYYLLHGTVANWTGKVQQDSNGNYWYQVRYVDAWDRVKEGWVPANSAEPWVPTEAINMPGNEDATPLFNMAKTIASIPENPYVREAAMSNRHNPQQLDLSHILEKYGVAYENAGDPPSDNLCGLFAVAAATNKDIIQLIEDWIDYEQSSSNISGRSALDILKTDSPTYRSEVERVLDSIAVAYEEQNDYFSPTEAQQRMENGERLVMLAGVQGGKLVSGGVGHWIVVEDVNPAGNSGWVRIWHSSNRQDQPLEKDDPILYEQILTYEEFMGTIENPGMGNSVDYHGIWISSND